MMERGTIVSGLLPALVAFLLALPEASGAAPLPKATQEILKKMKLNPLILADVDKELQVPEDWIAKAKTEGKVRVRGTPDSPEEAKLFFDSFRERYPFIDFDYSGSNQEDRSVKTLMALRAGRVISDVVLSVGGFILEYKKARALDDLKVIPAWKTATDAAKEDPDGHWVGKSTSYWCMAYNTKMVRKADLPRKWEDLVTNPKWRGGNLGLANRPQVWALNVWAAHGESWTKDFLTRLFMEVKPQLRKEGLNLMPQLTGAGEFQAALPSSPARTSQMADEGAPVGLVCPEPLPASTASVMILKGSPNINASRIFVNWLLSKEGQIAQFAAKRFTPIHKDLQRKEFVPFADQVLGRKVSYSNPMTELEILPKLYDHWNKLWIGRGR
jgi:iron(III) transport system substrate-binding protein